MVAGPGLSKVVAGMVTRVGRSPLGLSNVGLDDRPGITRQLRRSQLAALWRDLEALGLGEPDAGNHLGNPSLLKPSRREIVQVIELQREGRDWTIVHRFEVPEPTPTDSDESSSDDEGSSRPTEVDAAVAAEDPRIRAAIRRIAALAWASDLPPDSVPRFPERYDFGPDPWARYRGDAGDGS